MPCRSLDTLYGKARGSEHPPKDRGRLRQGWYKLTIPPRGKTGEI